MQTPYSIFGPIMGISFATLSHKQLVLVHVWICFDDPCSLINSRQIAHNSFMQVDG